MVADVGGGVDEADQVRGHDVRALVEELVVGVLAVGARGAPDDRPRLVGHPAAVEPDGLAVRLHVQLLEVGREPAELLAVRQHRVRLELEEVRVPDAEQRHEDRQVRVQGCAPEVLVHVVEAREQLAEVVRADGDHQAQADGGVHRVPPAHPVPEAEHVGGVDAELGHLRAFVETATKCFATAASVAAQPRQEPVASGSGVGQRLERRERLGRDDEQRLGRVEVQRGVPDVGPVDVGHEPELHRPQGVVAQRLGGHRRPQVRAADADVDDGPDALPGEARPLAVAHADGEGRHAVQHGVDVVDDVLAVDDQALVAREAQGGVEDGAVLGLIDARAREHLLATVLDARGPREVQQERQRLGRDPVLRVVEEQTGALRRAACGPVGVVGEQVAQVAVADGGMVVGQGAPLGGLVDGRAGSIGCRGHAPIVDAAAAAVSPAGRASTRRAQGPTARPARCRTSSRRPRACRPARATGSTGTSAGSARSARCCGTRGRAA